MHVADIRADPDYAAPEALASGRRQLGVPLLRDSELIGIIMLSRKRIEPPSAGARRNNLDFGAELMVRIRLAPAVSLRTIGS